MTDATDYERDHSHYHCWDITPYIEGICGQEGHEKHLARCICRKPNELLQETIDNL